MTRAIWIVTSTLFGLMTCPVIGQFPIEIRQGVTPSEFPNERTLYCRANSASGTYNPIENAIFYLNGNDIRQELTGSEFEYSGSAGRIIIQLRQDLEGTYTCGDGTTTSPDPVILVCEYIESAHTHNIPMTTSTRANNHCIHACVTIIISTSYILICILLMLCRFSFPRS